MARSEINKLPTDQLNQTLATIYGKQKPVIVVDNINKFFSTDNLMRCLESPDHRLHLNAVLEYRGIQLNEIEMAALNGFHSLKSRIAESIQSAKPIYNFEPVPDSWSVERNLKLTHQSICRHDDSGYSIGYKALETVWKRASRIWAGIDDQSNNDIGSIPASGYRRRALVEDNQVTIGCQSIMRYEIEQVALHLGWEFPTEAV